MSPNVLTVLIGLTIWGYDVTDGQNDKLRLCVFSNRAQYRQDYSFTPDDIDPFLCTHIIYSYATLVGTNIAYLEWNDVSAPWRVGMYEKTMRFKEINPNLKVVLSVGGVGFDIRKMAGMLATFERRQAFILSTIDYLRLHDFDGLDLNMDYPGALGSALEDKQRYADLIQELHDAFAAISHNSFTLSVTVRCEDDIMETAYAVSRIQRYSDWIGLKTYQLAEGIDSYTRFHSALYAHDSNTPDTYKYRTIEWCANRWTQGGAPKDKLVIGLGTFGRGFILASPDVNGLYVRTYGRSYIAEYTAISGVMAYYEICSFMLNAGGIRVWRDDYGSPYVYKDNQWYSYDDIQSIQLKVQWLVAEGFAGYLAWSMDFDDYTGMNCGQGVFPLLTTMNNTLLGIDPPSSDQGIPTTTQATTVAASDVKETTTVSPAVLCEGKAFANIEDPADCSRFYMCWSEVPYAFSCSAELYYNPKVQVCDWRYNLEPDRQYSCGLVE